MGAPLVVRLMGSTRRSRRSAARSSRAPGRSAGGSRAATFLVLVALGAMVGASLDLGWMVRGLALPAPLAWLADVVADVLAPLRHLAWADPPSVELEWTRLHQAALGAALPVVGAAVASWRHRVWLVRALKSELVVFGAVRSALGTAHPRESETQALARSWLEARGTGSAGPRHPTQRPEAQRATAPARSERRRTPDPT